MRHLYALTTPENVRFEFELPGIATRAFAFGIDFAAMTLLTLSAFLLASLLGVLVARYALALYFLLAFAIQWGYGAVCEWRFAGQTPGKLALGIRVLSAAGTRITFTQALIRNLLRIVDLLPGLYLVGGCWALLDRDARRLGDLAAGTVVVRIRRAPRPNAILPPNERYNSFIEDPAIAHACARVTAPERDVMIGLALGRERLPLALRHELFDKLARHLETRLALARPAHFSAERFVLNLTAVVLGARARSARAS